MATYSQINAEVRGLLIEPSPDRPSEPFVFRHLKLNAQLLFNQGINAPPSWCLAYYDLNVTEGEGDTYSISRTNFGKDTLVHTIDDTDPNHVERPIRRMSVQSSLLGGNDPYAYASNFTQRGIKHGAQTFVFWREPAGAIKVKVMPKPDQDATYRIWYETNEPDTTSLGNTLEIPAAFALLCVKTAFDCLPGTEWSGNTKKENSDQRKELALTLGAAATEHRREWVRYISTDRTSGRVLASGFDDANYRWS